MARMPRLILLLTSILLLSLSVGCSSNAVVTLKPLPGNRALTATFTRTCYQKDQSGQDEIVLESDPINEPIDTAPGQPINAVTTPPLWQVLVIQLHWRTSLAGSPDSPVGDNAVMHWYIYGKPDRQGTALIEYLGTGPVSVSPNSSGAAVGIYNAELHCSQKRGNLKDPLVHFRVNSQFNAVEDPVHLHEILSDLQKAIADTGSTATSQAGN